ncbi:YPDG domain-containing protein [Corynebacterium propinquum]|uniref:YPDG domain-containing protein n=1 Tax=Corynebacterium propinquum TaxID=43769 RepID=UPI0030803858
MNHNVPANKPVRRRGVTIAAAALSVALVAPFAQSVAYPEITAAAQAQEATPKRVVQTLKENPPTFYANAEAVNTEVAAGKEKGPRTVRTTGVLALPEDSNPDTGKQQLNLFFPRGTTFRVRDLNFGFTEKGWYGVARKDTADPESLKGKTSEMQAQATGTAYPYVVPSTGQILFGLQKRAEGTSETVPMQARWTDASGNEFIWNYDQQIVVGVGKTQSARECGPDQKHISPLSMESVRQTGSFVLGNKNTLVGSNFGWYQQPMGSIGACMNVNDLPSSKSKQVDFKYVNPTPGDTVSGVPTFHQDGKPENEVKKPGKVTFELGENAPSGASIDPETGVVSFENPVGQKTTVPVKATYDDGSFDTAKVEFKPSDKRTADELTPSYKPLTLDQGQESAVDAPGFDKVETPDVETDAAPGGTTFKLKGDPRFPNGVNVQVNPDGSVNVAATDKAQSGNFSVPVEVTYPDKSTDTVDVQVTVNEAPSAPSITGDAAEGGNKLPEGTPTKVGQKVANPTEGMSGTVTIDDKPVADAKVVVDPETGEITVTVPEGTLGDGVSEKPAKVQITDAGGNNVGGPIDATVTKDISKVVDPNWNDTNLPDDGSRVNVPNTGDEIPHDTDVDLLVGYGEHNKGEQDWTVRLEENGSITVIPGGDAAPEDSIEVHVELTYADGSTETKTFIVKVPLTFEGFFPENLGEPDYPNSEGSDRPNTPNTTHGEFGPITSEDSGDITAGDVFDQADRFDPEWNDTDTPEDGSAVTVNNTGDDLPNGTTVELGWGHGTHNKGTQDWDVELEENGDITVTPGADAEHGDSVLVQAVITYADGSTETKEFIVQVPVSGEEYVPGNFGEYGPMLQSEETELTAEEAFGQAEMIEPNWADTSTPEDGSPVTVKNTGDALPNGTKVDLGWGHGTHNKGTQDWDVDLEENGDITVKPGADAKPGDSIVVEVSITYPDGTKETKSFITQVPVTGEEFVPGNFGELPPLTGDDNDDLTAGDVFTEAPTVNPVNPGDNAITGTGKPGATITVTGPNGFSTTTKVNENGNWSIDVPGGATPESQYIVSQKDGDKAESDQVIVTVGKGGGELVNPGLSSGSSNFDIPKHLQCAVFAGGVTAIPLILLSPMHNMYEMMINPHLNGLREQFHRELHALDQQVRRGLGVEGHPALQFMDHINARVNEFNQQLGQVAHDNRHIGLAAAAIAVAGLSFQHCMNTQAASSSSASSVDLSSSSQEQAPARNEAKEDNAGGIVGWFQGLFNRK